MTTPTTFEVFRRCGTSKCPHCAAGHPSVPAQVADGSVDGLWELDEDVRRALPPHFHQPHFDGLGQPNSWQCTACWGDGVIDGWPCTVAMAHGEQVAQAIGVGWSR